MQDSQDVPELPQQEDLLEDFGVAPAGELSNRNGGACQDSIDSIDRSLKHIQTWRGLEYKTMGI